MSADKPHRALIVDDEKVIRKLVAKALADEGFECDLAADGDEAAQLIGAQSYDLLVTDLKMPNRHGHALVRDVLLLSPRPIIIVHTSVMEPKIVRDLLSRGIDDIVYKPSDAFLVAAKAKILLERRTASKPSATPASGSSIAARLEAPAPAADLRVDAEILTQKLNDISSVLPISKAALDVYQMTRSCDWEISQIAAAIQRDASLSAEVLRLANSSFYNTTGKGVINLDQAVMSIGQTRIGEMAMALNALAMVTPSALPWMNLDLAWRRSMAAGVAVETLIDLGGHSALEEGLSLSATMYPLGRVVLGAMFPPLYKRLASQCSRTGESLREIERTSLPVSHSHALAQLFAVWRIPPDLCLPLKHAADEFSSIARQIEPLRTRTELLKLAVLVGRIAVGGWEPWDSIDFPPATLLERLKTPIVDDLIGRIRVDVAKLAEFHPGRALSADPAGAPHPARTIAYCNIAGGTTDLLAELLPSLGYRLQHVRVEQLRDLEKPVVINGIDAAATRFAAHHGRNPAIVVTTPEKADGFGKFARTISVPCSFSNLRTAIADTVGETALPPARPSAVLSALNPADHSPLSGAHV
jgi:DNA-binding response OmpR family regulator